MVSAAAEKAVEEALRQIRKNDYFAKYRQPGQTKALVAIGAGFDLEGRGLAEWQAETIL